MRAMRGIFLGAMIVGGVVPGAARAEQVLQVAATDAGFEPAQLRGATGEKVRIEIANRTAAAIEFESFDLNRERVVPPGQTVSVYVSGLDAGRYEFFDDFNQAHRGALVVE